MYMLGHLAWGVLQPGNLLLLLLLIGVGGGGRWRRRLIGTAALGLLLLAATPVGALLLRPLEMRFPPPLHLPPHIDGILVLGGGVDPGLSRRFGATALGANGGRMAAGVALALAHGEARLALIGGEGELFAAGLPEARASLAYVLAAGIDQRRVVLEEKSRSTHENAIDAKAVLQPREGENWLLVTSAWHMPRSVAAFRGAGWQVIPYPVDYAPVALTPNFSLRDGLDAGTLALKEWIGLAWYRLNGWSAELYPEPTG